MKRCILLIVVLLVFLTACQSETVPAVSAGPPINSPPAEERQAEDVASKKTDNTQPSGVSSLEIRPTYQDEYGTVLGGYYTLHLPASWDGNYIMECSEMPGYGYSADFFERLDHESDHGGFLFSICLFSDTADYSYLPSYDILGSVFVYRIGAYNIIVRYPTDVQFADENIELYNQMTTDIPKILQSVRYNEECEFSETPLEVKNTSSSDESLSMTFYAELCTYVTSSCVNYTEWWSDPEFSVTDPTYYYLEHITADNYDEKMEKAKQLVDGVYKAGYWEIRDRGYGTLKIGIFITSDDNLYFCYRY